MTIFPVIQPKVQAVEMPLPIYREIAWDYEKDEPIFENGSPVIIEKKEALTVWVWNALNTVRGRHEIFTRNYGNDMENLIGQPYSEDLKRAEAARYVRECLLINPYIKSVDDISVSFSDCELTVSLLVSTAYGDIKINKNEVI